MSEAKRVSIQEAKDILSRVLVASNTSPENAMSVATALVSAEIDGQGGHGFSRLSSYCAQARSGKVDGHATADLQRTSPGVLTVDAKNGFAFPAFDRIIEDLPEMADETGIAAASVYHSHHCGQAGYHVERLAEQGCLALMVCNTPKAMAPWGGKDALFGTNPIAFAAPRLDAAPLVIDLSLSKVARGKIMAAKNKGESIPEGWALDADGQPTTDPVAALQGTMIPMGDAKGSALALMIEILCAGLTGANFGHEATSFFDGEGAPPGVGQLVIAFSPKRFIGQSFGSRLEELCMAILAQDGTRLPGASKGKIRQQAEKDGIDIDQAMIDSLLA